MARKMKVRLLFDLLLGDLKVIKKIFKKTCVRQDDRHLRYQIYQQLRLL